MAILTRALFNKELRPGLNAVFGLEYKDKAKQWTEIFDEFKSKKSYEEDVLVSGFGLAPVKAEGAGVAYDSAKEIYTARYIHETIALACAITREMVDDNLYMEMGAKFSRAIARSLRITEEVKAASILNNAFSSSFPGGDGVALLATTHPTEGGTQVNTFGTNTQLSEDALEQLLILINKATDHRGLNMMLQATKLIVPPDLQMTAYKILNTPYRTSAGQTANSANDVNAIVNWNLVSGGMAVNNYLTDSDAWFVKTDCPDGLKRFTRMGAEQSMQPDFNTQTVRMLWMQRYAFGWSDWRGIFGANGA